MSTQGVKRKLTAILSADVKGYSRLMGEDEEGTVRTLTAYRDIITGLIQQYRGRVVDSPGDNLLAEFTSIVDAVQCAVEIQLVLRARNTALPENRRMEFRIGVNLGDVIEEGERIYGDGVNIAARLESMAEAGGICISGSAYDQIKNKLALGYEYLGEHEVKNIAEPVRVYKTQIEPTAIKVKSVLIQQKLLTLIVTIILVLGAGTFVTWNWYFRPSVEPASVEKMVFSLPDKPSIAILPFSNMSDDPKQEYFSDGITDDLITDLSKIPGIFVIARNSTFVYKGKPVKIKQVSEELSVRYVLEGSVRKAGDEVRITAQLIDATTGHYLWANRYDGKLKNVFSLQDQITQKIVSELEVKLGVSKQKLIALKETENFEAYDTFLKGWGHYLRTTEKDFRKAISYFEKVIELDPDYGRAYAALALTHLNAAWRSYIVMSKGVAVTSKDNNWIARKYLKLAMKNPSSITFQAASDIDLKMRRWQDAIDNARKALDLDSNDARAQLTMGRTLIYCGKPAEAIDHIKRALRLDPHYPALPWALLGLAYFCMEKYEEASNLLERSIKNNPDLVEAYNSRIGLTLASTYAHLGREKDALAAIPTLWRNISLRMIFYRYPFMYAKDAARLAEGLIKGLPPPHEYYKAFTKYQLTGKEIKDLMFDRKTGGLDGIIKRSEGGATVYKGVTVTSTTDTGKSWIEKDMLCEQWQTRFTGMKICYPIFRNPEGTRAMLNEYLYIRDDHPYPFSPLD